MYIDLTSKVDTNAFNLIQEEIHTGIANARELAIDGTWSKQLVDNTQSSYPCGVKLLQEAYKEFLDLPEDSLVKQVGLELYNTEFNVFGTYLKTVLQAYDCYYYFKLITNGVTNLDLLTHFPTLYQWIEDTKGSVFSNIKNATIIVCEANGMSWEHKNLDSYNEFIYVRHNLQKPTYLWDNDTQQRTYINSTVAWWNPSNWQGADRVWEQSYALKIEGDFLPGVKND